MKNKKKLQIIFDNAKGTNQFYGFESFLDDAKSFLHDVKKGTTVCHIESSRSGMSRTFNFDKYNMLLNICYNGIKKWDKVKVGGCGMDMHWHLKFSACERLCTRAELDKYNLNSRCSGGKTI